MLRVIHRILDIFLLLFVHIYSHEVLYDPTLDEINQGIAVFPSKSWGISIRKEKSARILALGGSNTATSFYVEALDAYLKIHISNTSFVLNEGISGCDGSIFLGKYFPSFENSDISQWPNIVLLEFSINFTGDVKRFYEALIHFLIRKWKLKGLPKPSFIILNVFKFKFHLKHASALQTRQDRINFINGNFLSKMLVKNRGCDICPEILEFARTFAIPVWSWVDAAYPAFVRYFIGSGSNASSNARHPPPPPWRFSDDFVHFSKEGAEFFVEHIAGPFLVQQSRPRDNEEQSPNSNWSDIYSFDLRLTSGSIRLPEMLAVYSSWGMEGTVNTLKSIVVVNKPPSPSPSPSLWGFSKLPHRRHQPGLDHICLGSHTKGSQVEFELLGMPVMPSTFLCNQSISGFCSLVISSVHSWNTSYIGHLTCSVFQNSRELRSVFIHGNRVDGKWVEGTVPLPTVLYENISHGEKYSVKCRKLDRLYSCIDSIFLKADC